MSVPKDLQYTKEHEWVRMDGDVATVGITFHAQDQLGDVVYVELPAVGSRVKAGATFGTVESVKAVSDLYAPVTGEVVEVNEQLADGPNVVNEDPYGAAWLIKVKVESAGELLSAEDYEALVAG